MSFKRGHLRYFVTVADEGQITRAAAKLHIAQPALSQAISQLEAELGVELLTRNARGVTLTSAGEAFLPKARAAVASEHDVELTGLSLARAAGGILEVGFIGPPPTMSAPELFATFAAAHPHAELAFRDLPFPRGSTRAWLQDVDVAFCHPPMIEPGISTLAVRSEPRAVVVHRGHPLAQRTELTLAEVLDETFVSYHPEVQPAWAGFHSFDDHRGAPPGSRTADRVLTSLQMLGTMSTRRAITTVPLSDARLAQQVLPDVVAIPVVDAEPAVLSFVWHTDKPHPLVQALVATARPIEAP
jgi:DNA-binding transcriptional LysR family regulator